MSSPDYPAEALLEKGQELLEAGQPQVALRFFQKGIKHDSGNSELLEALGATYMELGDIENALISLKKCVEVSPEESGNPWMYLGQLQRGAEALENFKKGAALIKRDYETACGNAGPGSMEASHIRMQLSAAYCSLAEMYLTDLCFENEAEKSCEMYLKQALDLNPEDPQALQAFASFCISKNKPDDARIHILKALKGIEESMRTHNDLSAEENFVFELLPFEFRVCTARILIELKEYTKAISLLDQLVEEDDEVVEVWILLGHCHISENDGEAAGECLSRGKEMVTEFLKADADNLLFREQKDRIESLEKKAQNITTGCSSQENAEPTTSA